MRALYRRFKDGDVYDVPMLPIKTIPKGHIQSFRRKLKDHQKEYSDFVNEFGYLQADTIVGLNHKSTVMMLVECLVKVIINLKPDGQKTKDIKNNLDFCLIIPH